jgi:hypothetical protein
VHLELLIPALLWARGDAATVMRGLATPTLERWLSRGRPGTPIALSAEQWLWQRFTADRPERGPQPAPDAGPGPAQPGLPLAAVTLAADGHDPGMRWWLRADPVHVVVGRTGLRLAPPSMLQLREDESSALAAALRAHFGDRAEGLLTPSPARWYFGADQPFALETTAPSDAIGADVDLNLPRGPGRRQWLGFVNEVQMLWFEHPVNQARERRGEPTASGLWLHGAGRRPGPGQPGCSGAAGGGELLAGLAALNGCRWLDTGPDDGLQDESDAARPWLARAGQGRWLLCLDALLERAQAGDAPGWRARIERLETRWLAPLDAALRSGLIDGIDLRWPCPGGLYTIHVAASDRLRFWRRPRALADHAAGHPGGNHA